MPSHRRRSAGVVAAIALVLAVPGTARAADVTLGFDDLAPGTVVDTQYADAGGAGHGVVFGPAGRGGATPVVFQPAAGLASSPPSAARVSPCPPPNGPVRAHVSVVGYCGPEAIGTFGLTKQRVSVRVGLGAPGGSTTAVTLTAYDAAGDPLDSTSSVVPAGGALSTPLSIQRLAPEIASFGVSAAGREFAIDDLSFDNPVAPPPPDFGIRARPLLNPNGLGSTDLVQGGDLEVPLDVTRVNGSNGPITFSVSSLPPQTSGSVEPVAVGGTGPATVRLKLGATASAPVGSYYVHVTATPQTAAVAPAPRAKDVLVRIVRRDLYDAQVTGMEVTQGIQGQFGMYVPPLNGRSTAYGILQATPLAAGGETIVRAWASNATTVPAGSVGGNMVLYGTDRNGNALPGSPISPSALENAKPSDVFGRLPSARPPQATSADRRDPASAFEFVLPWSWTKGRISLRAALVDLPDGPTLLQCGGCTGNDDFTLVSIPFTPVKTFLVHPMALYANGVGPVDEQTALAAAHNIFPVPLDTGVGYDVTFDATAIASKPKAPDRADAAADLVGDWESDHPNLYGEALPVGVASFNVNGVTKKSPFYNTRVSVEAIPGRPSGGRPLTSVAHEIGHALGREHASPCNGGGSNGQSSEDWPLDQQGWIQGWGLDRTQTDSRGFRPVIADPGPDMSGFGSWLKDSGASNKHWFDFMSYCAYPGSGDPNAWTSVRGWADLLSRWSAGSASLRLRHDSLVRAREAAVAVPGLHVIGHLTLGGSAVISYVTPRRGGVHGAAGSPLRVVARDGAGRVLASVPAAMSEGHVYGAGETQGFEADLPAPGAASITVEGAGGAELAVRARSAHAPVVRLFSPRRGSRVGGRRGVTVTWAASDRDGGGLQVHVEYSADGGRTWLTRFVGPSRGRVTLPSAYFGRSRDARVRVRASDGFNVAVATSARFTALGAPPAVAITSPGRRTVGRFASVLDLAGAASDDAGRRLGGRALRWVVGRRTLGYGARVAAVTIPPGASRVTLLARDRFGRVGRASVTVRVLRAPVAILRLRGPRRLSRRARSVTVTIAVSPAAIVSAGGRRLAAGRRARGFRIPVRPGRGTLRLTLRVTGGGVTLTRTLLISRR